MKNENDFSHPGLTAPTCSGATCRSSSSSSQAAHCVSDLQGRNLSKFDHVKNDRQLTSAEELAAQQADPVYSLKHMSEDMKRVMTKLNSADSATVRFLAPMACMQSVFRCRVHDQPAHIKDQFNVLGKYHPDCSMDTAPWTLCI